MQPGVYRPAALLGVVLALAGAGCAPRGAPPAGISPEATATRPLTPESALSTVFDAVPDSLAIWSIQFVWSDSGAVLYERSPDTRLLPASNNKLVTLAAAAVQLGWDHRFPTTVSASAEPVDGVLHGNLEVRGSGDPTFGWPTEDAMAQMRALARAVRTRGVVRVEGDLVGDPYAFGRDALGDSWSWDDLAYAYSAPYAGLTFHENTVQLRVAPAANAGEPARVYVEPVDAAVRLDAQVETVDAASASLQRLSVSRAPGSETLTLRGDVRVGAQPATLTVAVPDPARFFLAAFRLALALEGVEVRGDERVAVLPPLDAAASSLVLARHESAPLADLAIRFMKVSQNLYGEALQHALVAGEHATLAQRREAVTAALGALGVATDDIQVADGSGLSRRNFVSARTLVQLLRALDAPAHRSHVRRTLPVAGVDGTLSRRLEGTACKGRVLAKTGTLSHARALSGYLTLASGREITFSVLANNHLRPTAAIDEVVDAALARLCAVTTDQQAEQTVQSSR